MKNNNLSKNVAFWLIIVLLSATLYSIVSKSNATTSSVISYSSFLKMVTNDEIKSVHIKDTEYKAIAKGNVSIEQSSDNSDGAMLANSTPIVTTYVPIYDDSILRTLKEHDVDISVEAPERTSLLMQIFISWFPLIIIVLLWLFFMRQVQGGGNKAFSFGKSKAKELTQDENKTTLKDVAGVNEAKEELEDVIDFLRAPAKYTSLGGKIPKGILLVGPPGTGKTLLAKAIAGEAGVPFFSISGSDFVEMFVGVGASRVRDLFEQGKKKAPCIIFIDEIDAVGRQRGAGLGGGHDEREQTLNQMLVEKDGFSSNSGVILIAATNRSDVLDPALLRPGRFDRQVMVPPPDLEGRHSILLVHVRNVPLANDVELRSIARGTPGFSGADLANLVNEAALNAAKYNKDKVAMKDFDVAKDKIFFGKERKNLMMEEERIVTAYHEAGHAIVAHMVTDADPVYKVTITPRNMALGVTMQLPETDRYSLSAKRIESNISILLGGRSAEEIMFDTVTTGASNDIERATKLSKSMVCEWGMSKLGPIQYAKKEGSVFLGRELGESNHNSEEVAKIIDNEIREIIERNHKRARDILIQNKVLLEKMSEELLEKETIDSKDIERLVSEYATGEYYEASLVYKEKQKEIKEKYKEITERRAEKRRQEEEEFNRIREADYQKYLKDQQQKQSDNSEEKKDDDNRPASGY